MVSNFVLKCIGQKGDIEKLFEFLKKKYMVVPTSGFMDNVDKPGFHIFVSLVLKSSLKEEVTER